jgi:hypothetical protein
MSPHPLTPRVPRPDLNPGQAVHVNARAAWWPATVTSVAHTAIGVTLTSPTRGPLTVTVAPWVVRAAAGYRLAPVARLRAGDEIAAADGSTHTLAAPPWQGSDGWWVLSYDSGTTAALPPGTVLRLVDPIPDVLVGGIPLT